MVIVIASAAFGLPGSNNDVYCVLANEGRGERRRSLSLRSARCNNGWGCVFGRGCERRQRPQWRDRPGSAEGLITLPAV